VVDLVDRFRGGESLELISSDFGVPVKDVLEVVRAFYSAQRAAV
jgi:hypothetical protein